MLILALPAVIWAFFVLMKRKAESGEMDYDVYWIQGDPNH